MIIQRATGRHGGEYRYFFCRGVQSHVCDAPYSNLDLVEAAVEEHYKTLRFHSGFIDALRKAMHRTLADSASATRLLRTDLTKQLKSLDVKEDNLLDLAASGELARDKIQQRLRDVERQRAKLTKQLEDIIDDLPEAQKFLDLCLQLLEDPHRLYLSASDSTRRRLNQAIFSHLFVFNEQIADASVTSPLAELLAADAGWHTHQTTGSDTTASEAAHSRLSRLTSANKTAAGTPSGGSVALVADLLQAVRGRDDCSKHSMVRAEGLEPTRSYEHGHLKPARLPFRHARRAPIVPRRCRRPRLCSITHRPQELPCDPQTIIVESNDSSRPG